MKITSIALASVCVSAAVLLSACSGHSFSGSSSAGSGWGSYKCTAVRGEHGRRFTGWATSKRNARSSALSKCEAGYSGSCSIAQCIDQG